MKTLALTQSIGIVCGGDAVRLPFDVGTFGCATGGTVDAWLERADPTVLRVDPCGPHSHGWGKLRPASPIREAKVPVFVGKNGGGCDNGEQNAVELVFE